MTSLGFTKIKLPEPKVELLIEKIVDVMPFEIQKGSSLYLTLILVIA